MSRGSPGCRAEAAEDRDDNPDEIRGDPLQKCGSSGFRFTRRSSTAGIHKLHKSKLALRRKELGGSEKTQ